MQTEKPSEEQLERPTLISPQNDAVLDNNCDDYSDSIEWDFDWSDVQGATKYQIYVIHEGATSPQIDTIVTSSCYHYSESGYIHQDNRFNWMWKVKAGNDNNLWSEWSEERYFDVEPLNKDCVLKEPKPDRRYKIIYPGIADRNHISWFIHISDVHLGKNDSATSNLEWIRDRAYAAVDPDFVVATGDLTESALTGRESVDQRVEPILQALGHDDCCMQQSSVQWESYHSIVADKEEFRQIYYDLAGNHDRYGDPEWDGYANNSIRGPTSNPIGQFIWSEKGNYFITVNTCDETGKTILGYNPTLLLPPHISDLPVLNDDKDGELDTLEAKLIQAHSDPNSNLAFVFGHHSIFTRPRHPENPGLYDPLESIDEEDLNARGAQDFISLLNTYQVSAYGFGHTHESETFFEEKDREDNVPWVSALQMNPGALVDGEYAIVAIDNGGVSTTTATVGNWPVVLITAPVDIHLGGANPYCYPLPKHEGAKNKVRALVFNPDKPDDPSDDLTEGDPTNDFDGDVQFSTTGPLVGYKDMKKAADHIWEADLDVSSFSKYDEHQVWVKACARNGSSGVCRVHSVSFKVAEPIATFELDPVQPGDDCTITVTGFEEGAYFRVAWDGQSLFATEQIVNSSSSVTFQIPDDAEAGPHYVRAFDEKGNYIVYYISVIADNTPPDPNPMTWATEPYTADSTSISMVATTATDSESPPVSYFFDFVDSPTGGTGGSDSSWQTETSYTDTGLQPNHRYGYQVKARDSASTPNETNHSTPVVYKYTLANAPEAAPFSGVTETSIQANWTANGNPSWTEYLCENTTTGTNSGWTTNTYWDCTGLTCGTTYSFTVKARNKDRVETVSTELGSQSTRADSDDITPPTPNPMTWATEPYAAGSTSISMVATTATDSESPPVSYFFDFVDSPTGGTGGSDSSWQTETSYTDTGLQPNHRYGYQVKARDSASTPNETNHSTPVVYKYTLANAPEAAPFSGVTETSIQANWTANGNPSWTEYLCENTTTGTNSGWTTNTYWDCTGLTCGTTYSFTVKARNRDGVETVSTELGSQSTQLCAEKGDLNGDSNVDLSDAIFALQVMARKHPPNVYSSADVNGDGKIGLAEIIFILQQLAELRLDSTTAPHNDGCYLNLSSPELIVTGTEDYEANGQEFTRYLLSVTNRSIFPNELFEPAPDLPPCGLNSNASRTWVHIYNGETGARIYGFCALRLPEHLDSIWFAVPRGEAPPPAVYISLEDRRCDITYTSNLASTEVTRGPSECNDNADCEPGSYCAKMKGDCGGRGHCSPRPEVCPTVMLPVCGCDGITYGNACEAAQSGVSVAYDGLCTD